MVDIFTSEQGRRLFGQRRAGGTIGGIAGSTLTSTMVAHLGRTSPLLASAVLLETAVVQRPDPLQNFAGTHDKQEGCRDETAIGGSVVSEFRMW
jgi:AAA family ATP:ADP antiporter